MFRTPRMAGWLGLGFLLLLAPSAHAQLLASLWQFDGNLDASVGGNALVAHDFSPSFATPNIGGNPANVLDLPALGVSQGLRAINPIGPTDGGSNTNTYTLIMDVYINSPTIGFASLLSTDTAATPPLPSDVDVFVRGSPWQRTLAPPT